MRTLDVPQSGSRGNVVASRNRFGRYLKARAKPEQPATPAQCAMWSNTKVLSQLWNTLADGQRVAWRRLAQEFRTRRVFGQSGPLDGCLLFKKLNHVLAICRRQVLFDPPPQPDFGPNPVNGFEVRDTGDRLAFKLLISPKVRWEARSPLEDIMLFASPPRNAGVEKDFHPAFIGAVPPPVDGGSDFTALYMRKLKEWRKLEDKRYRVPLEGSRVFIRAWQQMNGWEDVRGMFRTNTLVPNEWDEAERTEVLLRLQKRLIHPQY